MAGALLRSIARKMSRAAAPTHHHYRVARGLHSGPRPVPANQVQQGTADALVSAGMAAASGLRSGAGRLTTTPPPQYHRLVHGRRIQNSNSPDPSPSTAMKVIEALDIASDAVVGVACVVLIGSVYYVHFVLEPELKKLSAMTEDLRVKIIDGQNMEKFNMDASSVSHRNPTAPASVKGKEHL